jgi:hypothetical protein
VLGGALSPIDGVDPDDLKIAELLTRVAAATADQRGRAGHQPDDDRRATALPSPRSSATATPTSS